MPRTKQVAANLTDTNPESKARCRYWCFTLNNYDESDIMKLKLYATEKCRYMAFGKEGADKTPHLQGYIQLSKATAGTTVRNQSRCLSMWLTPTNGNGTSARDYCFKEDDNPYQFGNFIDHPATKEAGAVAGNSASTQMWHSLNDLVNSGATEKEIKDKFAHIYYKHHSGIQAGISCANAIPPRKEKTCVHVLVGPAGCGKTSKAMELAGQDAYLYSSPNKIWWSGYDGTSSVIMDDFHGNYPFGDFKQMTDKYPHKVPVHGNLINFNPKKIIVTSNLDPTEWWKTEVTGREGYAALYRRINVLEFWDSEKECFIATDKDYHRSLWHDGCLCQTEDPPTIEVETPPPVAEPKLKRSHAVADLDDLLDNCEFPMEDFPFLPLTKRQKILKAPLNRTVPSREVVDLTSSQSEVESESDEDDDDDSSGSFDDSCNDTSGEEMSEQF